MSLLALNINQTYKVLVSSTCIAVHDEVLGHLLHIELVDDVEGVLQAAGMGRQASRVEG
jgi:hypothetical protein